MHDSEINKFNRINEATGILLTKQYVYFMGGEEREEQNDIYNDKVFVKQYLVFNNEGYEKD